MENLNWKSTTKQIYTGVMLYSICGMVAGLVGVLAFFLGGFWGVLSIVVTLAIIVGYILYFLGLRNFKNVVKAPDAPVVNKLYTAVILIIIGYVLGFIPVAGSIIAGILNLIAFIMMLVAYNKLKKSETFPELARKGASMLFSAMILALIAVVLGIIPLVGTIIAAILNIISFILVLLGWKKVADADMPAEVAAE